jgi:hypothetical protein
MENLSLKRLDDIYQDLFLIHGQDAPIYVSDFDILEMVYGAAQVEVTGESGVHLAVLDYEDVDFPQFFTSVSLLPYMLEPTGVQYTRNLKALSLRSYTKPGGTEKSDELIVWHRLRFGQTCSLPLHALL